MNKQTTMVTVGQISIPNTNKIVAYTTSTLMFAPGGNGTAYLVLFGFQEGAYNVTFWP
jgi:hypothetical protein